MPAPDKSPLLPVQSQERRSLLSFITGPLTELQRIYVNYQNRARTFITGHLTELQRNYVNYQNRARTFITGHLTEWRRIYVNRQDSKWAFITKIFFIVFLQLLVAAAVSTSILHDESAIDFFKSTWLGIIIYILICLAVPLDIILIFYDRKNVILFLIFILASGSAVGLLCVYIFGKVVQQTLIITAVTFAVLTFYAFFASFIPYINQIFVLFILGIMSIIGLFIFIQKHRLWPWLMLGGLTFNEATIGAAASIVFCVVVLWRTDTLVRREEIANTPGRREESTIWASMVLYQDVAKYLGPLAKCIYEAVTKKN